MMPAKFITLEGIEGAGKTTVADRLSQSLRTRGITVHATREPGGTKVAERVRALVLERGEEHISATAETLLMFGARQVHVDNLIRPALTRGEWVLCDRFTDATHAYQGGGRGVDRRLIDQIAHAVHGDLNPDCTILLDVPVKVGLERMQARRGAVDRFEIESAQFFDRVAQEIAFAPGALDLRAMRGDRLLRHAARVPQAHELARGAFEAAVRIEQAAMGAGIDQRPIIVLAVDLDQRGTERAQHLHADRLVVDEGAGAAVGKLHAAQDQLVLGRDVVRRQNRVRRMVAGNVEGGGDLPLLHALAHQSGVAAGAKRQREGVEQDRLARAGLAGEHRQAGGEIDIEPLDQDDIADGQAGEHRNWLRITVRRPCARI